MLASQNVQMPAAVVANVLSVRLYRKISMKLLQKHRQFQLTVTELHLKIRLFNHGLELKGFDEFLRMNAFTLHAD